MKKMITAAGRWLGCLLAALGIMASIPGLILVLTGDGLLEWIDKKDVGSMTDEQRRIHYGYGRKW